MKQYIVGKISDQSYVAKTGIYRNNPPSKNHVKSWAEKNFDVTADDCSVYAVEDVETIDRLKKDDEFNLAWSDGVITALDFTPEDNKNWLEVTADKDTVLRDGTDTITITAKVLLADQSGVDNNYNESIIAQIKTPMTAEEFLQAKFTNGKCVFQLNPAEMRHNLGRYIIPNARFHIANLRIKARCEYITALPVG